MEYKHVQVGGKDIHIFDGLLDFSFREQAYTYARYSKYTIDNQDSDALENSQHQYIVSFWTEEEFINFGLLDKLAGTKAGDLLQGKRFIKANINLSTPTDTYWSHDHKNQMVALYYVNKQWNHNWAGETVFFNDDVSEVEYSSIYTPGRLIIFDGEIPHSIRPQSVLAPHYRFTLSAFFYKD
jgi:Rps23 Pro-64 3,4-dihydroxylase Tpa1-like proline 4-hydroxylase